MKRITVGTMINYVFIFIISAITLYPFIYILSMSVTPATGLLSGPVTLLPRGFDLSAYELMLGDRRLLRGFLNSVLYTTAGTAISVMVTAVTAYPLAQPRFQKYAKIYMKFVVFTMLFNAGLIPTFLVISDYGMVNTFWVMVLPLALNPFNLILTRTFMKELPDSMYEAAMLDGASQWKTFVQIIIPLSKPILACITFYYAVNIWNNYQTPLIYLRSDNMFPLQIFLRQIVLQSSLPEIPGGALVNTQGIQAASLVISTIPILVAFPFLQKYFVKGLLVGSIKG